jgi:hypothetical protein
MSKIKNLFGKPDAVPPNIPTIVMHDAKLYLNRDLKVELTQEGAYVYVVRFDLVTDLNGLQTILNSTLADGSVVVDVSDGKHAE